MTTWASRIWSVLRDIIVPGAEISCPECGSLIGFSNSKVPIEIRTCPGCGAENGWWSLRSGFTLFQIQEHRGVVMVMSLGLKIGQQMVSARLGEGKTEIEAVENSLLSIVHTLRQLESLHGVLVRHNLNLKGY